MSESPEKQNVPAPTNQPEPPTLTSDPRGLISLAEAARPLLYDYMRGQQESARQQQEHEFRLAELDARVEETMQRRVYPLIWFAVVFLALLIGGAAYKGNWAIVTHLLTALLGTLSGYALGRGQQRYRPAESQPADE